MLFPETKKGVTRLSPKEPLITPSTCQPLGYWLARLYMAITIAGMGWPLFSPAHEVRALNLPESPLLGTYRNPKAGSLTVDRFLFELISNDQFLLPSAHVLHSPGYTYRVPASECAEERHRSPFSNVVSQVDSNSVDH